MQTNNNNLIVRRITDPDVMYQLKESNKRKGMYAKQFRMQMLDLRTKLTLAEIKRQLYELQSKEVMPYFTMPFHNNMPATFLAINIKCDTDYSCAICNKRFNCFQTSVDRLTKRASKPDTWRGIELEKRAISDYGLLHGKTPAHVDDYNAALIESIKEIYISLGE